MKCIYSGQPGSVSEEEEVGDIEDRETGFRVLCVAVKKVHLVADPRY